MAAIANWTKHVFAGFSLASILLLMALGLAITFGLMGVINMAHGEMLMIGCVTTWACYEFIGVHLPPAWFNWYYVIAFPVSFLAAALDWYGWSRCWFCVISISDRWIRCWRPLVSALFWFRRCGVWSVKTSQNRHRVGFRVVMSLMQGVILPYNRLFIIFVSICAVVAVLLLFRFTRYGLLLRATVQNREVAQAMGINTRLIDMMTFALGSGIAGIAGWAIFLNTNPSPGMGKTYIVESFLVTVTGGVGNFFGVVLSALGIGTLTKLLEPISLELFSNSTWAWVAVLGLVILFIMRRPGGIFPDKGRLADQADRTTGATLMQMPAWGGWVGMAVVAGIGLICCAALYGTGAVTPET